MRTWHKVALPLVVLVWSAGPSLALIWHPEALDTVGAVGEFTSLDLDSASQPHIAYYDATNGDLKYAVRNGSTWQVSTVDSAGDVGQFCSIALDSNERPHISYYDATNQALKYARWTGSAWAIATVDDHSKDDLGQHTAIAVDSLNRPHISYYHVTDSRLYYARWTGSAWDTDLVDSGNVGKYTSIAVDDNDVRHISYYDIGGGELRHAWNSGAGWRNEVVDSDGDVGRLTSITLDNANRPRISYYDVANSALKFASFSGTAWGTQTVDNSADVGAGASIDIDSANRPQIAYSDVTNGDIKYARWDGAAWGIEPAETTGRVGGSPSMKLGFNDLSYVSYAHVGKKDLRFATPSGAWFFFSSEAGYEDGVKPNNGTADNTRFRFRVIYQDSAGWGPTNPVAIIMKNGAPFTKVRLGIPDPFPNFALGVELRGGTKLPAGEYTYRFRAKDQSGLFAGGAPTIERGLIRATGLTGGPAVASLSAVPTRAGAQITLALASAATVDARILNIAGRPVRQLVRGRECAAGTNTLLWSGQTDAGPAAPPGTYLVVVEARTEDGSQSRAICQVPLQR